MVNPWFLDKNGHFCNFFFVGNTCHENVVYDIPEKKKRLSRPKKQKVQKVEKIDIFPKGLNHGFGPKMAIFPTFFF